MIRNILGVMKDAGLYPAAALILFVVIFSIMLVVVNRMADAHIQRMKNLPLDKGTDTHE